MMTLLGCRSAIRFAGNRALSVIYTACEHAAFNGTSAPPRVGFYSEIRSVLACKKAGEQASNAMVYAVHGVIYSRCEVVDISDARAKTLQHHQEDIRRPSAAKASASPNG
jgi:hypothetical protein